MVRLLQTRTALPRGSRHRRRQNWTLDLIDGEDETDLAVGPQSASTLAEAKRMAQEWEAEFY
jgi:hypothetical protein